MLKPIDKQTLKSWYQYLAEPRVAKMIGRVLRTTGPRIAVVGACQAFSVASAIKLLCPSARVDHYPVISRSHIPLELFARTLETYDHVFMHEFPAGLIPGGGSAELRELIKKIIRLPTISFAAFHPDCISVGEDEVRRPIFGPLGVCHSALALFAYRKGLSLDEAHALFHRDLFEALGYFDFWNAASAELIESCKRDSGLDLSAEFIGWARRGVFMYTNNHPRPFVFADIAKRLLMATGLEAPEIDFDYYMIDDFMRYPIFPVYPPIAAHFGCSGSYTFRLTPAHPVQQVADYLLLPQFLAGSYAKYRRHESARLSNHRVDAWLGDRATAEMIVSFARKNLRAGSMPIR